MDDFEFQPEPDDEAVFPGAAEGSGFGAEAGDPSEYVDTGETKPKDNSSAFDWMEGKPNPKAARNDPTSLLTLMWGGAGMMLERSGRDIPVGRVLQFQAPVAGAKLAEAIANTWIDRVLQPFIKTGKNAETIVTLFAFPALVAAYERKPEIGPVIEGPMRQIIRSSLVEMAPVFKKRQAEERKAARAMKDLSDVDLGIDFEGDPIDSILAMIFAPSEAQTENAREEV